MTSAAAPHVAAATPAPPVDLSVSRLGRWVTRYGLRRWRGLLAVLAVMLLKIGLDVLRPWPMKVLVDHALGGQPITGALASLTALAPGAASREGLAAWSVAATVLLFLLGWALGVASAYANIGFGQRMVYDLAGDLFGHLQRLSLRFHARKSVGDSIRRVMTDSACVSILIRDAFLPIVASAVSLVTMLVVMWRLEPRLTLVAIAVVPWMVLVVRRYMHPLLEKSYAEQEAEGRMYDVVEGTLAAMPVIQAYGLEPERDRAFRETTDRAVGASLATVAVGLKFKLLTEAATAVGTASILWLGARSVLEGRLTVGGILVFVAYLAALYDPLESLMYAPTTTQGAAGSAKRVLEILETPQEVEDRPGAVEIEGVVGALRFEDVTFGYEPGRPVLRSVSLEVAPGETIAIVGRTGAGKSTLAGLLPRFYDPWGGRVTIDGRDIRDIRVRSLRARIAVVLQEPFLFPLSIAENIAYARPGASRREIEAAARAANAESFIGRLPAGYDTLVGERGATLSGGERQRISIARALLKDAPILILDEPTSALDTGTESLLLEALDRLMAGRTTIVIAHRMSTIARASRIVVLEDGAVAESGTHAELLARGGLYARYHALQLAPPGGTSL
jgi:ATP-binding cassette subfamily B protein/subfamily B ATP-binding cassette protein MsbA